MSIILWMTVRERHPAGPESHRPINAVIDTTDKKRVSSAGLIRAAVAAVRDPSGARFGGPDNRALGFGQDVLREKAQVLRGITWLREVQR